jgi:hypothetical protein
LTTRKIGSRSPARGVSDAYPLRAGTAVVSQSQRLKDAPGAKPHLLYAPVRISPQADEVPALEVQFFHAPLTGVAPAAQETQDVLRGLVQFRLAVITKIPDRPVETPPFRDSLKLKSFRAHSREVIQGLNSFLDI